MVDPDIDLVSQVAEKAKVSVNSLIVFFQAVKVSPFRECYVVVRVRYWLHIL